MSARVFSSTADDGCERPHMKAQINAKATPTVTSQFRDLMQSKPARGVLVALALGAAAYGVWHYLTDPPRPWLVRWRVQRFLKHEAHTSNFKTDFPLPSKAEMAKAPPKTGTANPAKDTPAGKDFETLRNEYFGLKTSALALERELLRSQTGLKDNAAQLEALTNQWSDASATNAAALQARAAELRARGEALQKKAETPDALRAKEDALAPIVRDLWAWQRGWQAEAEMDGSAGAKALNQARVQFAADWGRSFAQASSYAEMYRLIGQELWVASRLLDSANPEHQRAGITLALTASHHALDDAQNGWVAARICEGYVWPHLGLADNPNRRSEFNPENLITQCADIFRRNNEYQNVVRTYETYLARAGTPQRADWARSQLASALEQSGDARGALRYLRQIQNTNDYRGALRRVPRLEQQVKAK